MKVIHKRSNGNSLPAVSAITYGEIAVNYKSGGEALIIKNDSDEIVTFGTDKNNPFEPGSGENSAVLKGSNGTAFGANSVVEGASVTNAIERGITTASTVSDIIAEWTASTPDTDKFTLAKGEASHVEGNNGLALGDHSHVEGNGCIAGNNSSHAEGTGSQALGKYSHAEGLESIVNAVGSYSHAEGKTTYVEEEAAHSEGYSTKAKARGSHAEGYLSETSKSGYSSNPLTPKSQPSSSTSGWYNGASHAEGNATIAQGLGAHAEGEKTFANSRNGHAEGLNTKTFGDNSHAEGEDSKTNATAAASHVEGFDCETGGNYTANTKTNYDSSIKGEMSHAEGNRTIANGNAAHSEGKKTLASGTNSHAEGYLTIAAGVNSHAEGEETKINTTAEASHVEGYNCEVGGNYTSNTKSDYTSEIKGEMAHAEGNSTIANGNAAHSEGKKTLAKGSNSHAEGNETIANNLSEHAEGQYNVSNSATTTYGNSGNTQHSVGIGTGGTRKNAFEIMQNGDAYLYGVGGYDGTNATASTASTLQKCVGKMEEITWSNLKSLRDNGNLTPGKQYRIIDYNTTTVQANTQAAGHQFDIIVVADDSHTLNENARATRHTGDMYFTGATLEAWELKYDIDNDATKYAWADTGATGRGVIYYMKDEWGNECPYDFKNIQFVRKLTDGVYDTEGVDTFVYTFNAYDSDNGSINDASIIVGRDIIDDGTQYCFSNVIKPCTILYNGNSKFFKLNNNVFLNLFSLNEEFYFECNYNTLGYTCDSNTFGDSCCQNTLEDNCNSNIFGDCCSLNTFGHLCELNTFGAVCTLNTFCDGSRSNTFGGHCCRNTFGNECYNNTFGNYCDSNTFGNKCEFNTFGEGCNFNTFGNKCYSNTFGNFCVHNTFEEDVDYFITGSATGATTTARTKSYIQYLIVENGVQCVNAYCTGTTSSSNYCQNIKIGLGVKGPSLSNRVQINITPQINATASVTYQPANSQIISI